MRAIIFDGDDLAHIQKYDGRSHAEWDETTGPIVKIRASLRKHYLKEQSFRCAYCRQEKKESHGLTWDVEHIIPKSTHAKFLYEPLNLAMACKECNIAKGNADVLKIKLRTNQGIPNRSEAYTIVHPHHDRYSDHIEVTQVKGKITHRPKNKHKAKETFIMCDLIRFSYEFAEWDDFDYAITEEFGQFIERCPATATPQQIGSFIRTLRFRVNADF